MSHPIEPSTLRILNAKGQTIGTGFLVSSTLAVTCAHVALSASMDGENRIRVQFTRQKKHVSTKVLDEYLDIDRDVAILQVDEVPAGVFPLRMGSAGESKLKNDLYTFGYATAAEEQGIGGLGTFITLRQEGNFIQFRMHEANHGHSGAPIYDDKRGVVVGMLNKGHTSLGRNAETTFAIPTETIWQVCPQLKPPTPVLPHRNPIVDGINLLPYDYDQRIQNFLGEYLGNDAHPVPFGGRDDALHMLDGWLAEATPYLLLAAPAGRGKSALLVRWLDSLSSREDLALAFVPVSIRFGTNMERVFYAALAARLAFLHGDDVPASPETSTAVYRGLVSDYLSKPLANGRTLLVVLDGLDKAADWQAGADFMPGELPAGVRVVVSARFLAGDADSTPWLRRLNWERNDLASAPSLIPLDRAGVADVLLKMGSPLDELSRKVDIVVELYHLSAGDPLLVGLYVGDLRDKGEEVTRLKPEDLADIQPGYKGYFDRWWDDQKKLWGRQKPWLEQHVRAVRSLLAGAIGPLFMDDMQALAPELESDYIADALDILQRFIIGDNQTQGYTFSHPKLGQYFWEALTLTEQAQVEGCFLTWGEQTLQEFVDSKRDPKKKAEVPIYAVCNYGAHLTRAKQPIEKWLLLIHHRQWAQAWFTIEGAYGGYLQDVQRVWAQCKLLDQQAVESTDKAPYLGKQIRCALVEASLHSLAANIPIELTPVLVRVGIWTLSQAWVVIHQMPDPDQQADAILGLLQCMDDEQLPEALVMARAIQDEEYHARMLSALAQRLPDRGLEQVLAAARTIQDERSRALVLSALAQRLPERGLEQVLAAARAIQDEEYRAFVLSNLVQRLPEAAEEALTAARVIQDEWSRARVLSALAQRLPEVTGEALTAARAIQDEWFRALMLSALVQRLPEVAGEALAAARAIQDEESRASVLSAMAQCLPEVTGEALAAAQAVQNEEYRASVLSDLVQHLPEGELGQVLAAARAIQNKRHRASILSALVQRLPEVAGEALAAARAIWDERDYAHVLSNLAQHLPEGELGQVLTAARAIQDERHRASVLSELAQRLPEGKLEQVLAAARAIRSERDCALVLSALAQRLPEVAGEALTVARAIQDEWPRALVLSALVQHLSDDELEQVLAVARAIQDEWSRARILSALVQRLPEVVGEALAAAQAIPDMRDRANVLSDLAQRLPEVVGEALAAAQAIENEWSRVSVLSELAQRLPEGKLGQVLAAARAIQDESSRASVLSELAQRLPEGELGQVLAAARAIQSEWSRASVLSALAQRLPEAVGEALVTARAIQDEEYRARMLSALVQRLPEVAGEVLAVASVIQNEWDRANVLSDLAQRMPELAREVLAAARAIQNEWCRASVLSKLAQHLPEVAEEALAAARAIQDEEFRARVLSTLARHLPEVAGEALAAARAIQDEGSRARMLGDLAQHLPAGELKQVLTTVWVIPSEQYRAHVLSTLAEPLMKIVKQECYAWVETALGQLSLRGRANLFSDLAALMPVIIHLGAGNTSCEIYQAVRDVTTWWP